VPSLLDLYRTTLPYPPAEAIELYWNWRYRKNPLDDGGAPVFWVAKHGGRVVGALGQMPVLVDVVGGPLRAYWAVDFMVHPSHQGQGLGKRLMRHFRESNELVLSMGYAPDSVTSRIVRSVGFQACEPLPYLFKFYTLRPLAHRFRWTSPVAGGLSRMTRPWLGRLGVRSSTTALVTVAELSRFDESFDRLWRRVAGESPVTVRRTSGTMNWRYFDAPLFRYRAVGAWRDGELGGCLVFKVVEADELVYATIAEMVVPRPELAIQESLLAWALERCAEKRVDVVKSLVSPPHLVRLLRRVGFVSLGRGSDFVVSLRRADGVPRMSDGALRGDAWYLTKGDCDLDMTADFVGQRGHARAAAKG
jgi:GNAT superfamily N-acetyltransferase